MKTEVIMKRELFGKEISQKSKSEMFSATDLVRAGNMWRLSNGMDAFKMSDWLQQKNTKEFIRELESIYGKVKISGRGRGNHTWVHPLLFIDMALAISPKLKIEVYQWIYDSLLKHRNDSGTSYTKMAGALYVHESNKSLFQGRIKLLASKIKQICNVTDWQKATEEQLQLRDKIHNNIALLANVMRHNDKAIELGVREALK
jgi:hypothetical protein